MIQGNLEEPIACCSKYIVTPKKETLLDCYILKYRSIFREWPKKRFVADFPIQVWDFFVSQVSARVLRVEPPIHRIVCSSFLVFLVKVRASIDRLLMSFSTSTCCHFGLSYLIQCSSLLFPVKRMWKWLTLKSLLRTVLPMIPMLHLCRSGHPFMTLKWWCWIQIWCPKHKKCFPTEFLHISTESIFWVDFSSIETWKKPGNLT